MKPLSNSATTTPSSVSMATRLWSGDQGMPCSLSLTTPVWQRELISCARIEVSPVFGAEPDISSAYARCRPHVCRHYLTGPHRGREMCRRRRSPSSGMLLGRGLRPLLGPGGSGGYRGCAKPVLRYAIRVPSALQSAGSADTEPSVIRACHRAAASGDDEQLRLAVRRRKQGECASPDHEN